MQEPKHFLTVPIFTQLWPLIDFLTHSFLAHVYTILATQSAWRILESSVDLDTCVVYDQLGGILFILQLKCKCMSEKELNFLLNAVFYLFVSCVVCKKKDIKYGVVNKIHHC